MKLSESQAAILNLALDSDGVDEKAAASATGLTLEDTREALRYLDRQALLEPDQERYRVKEHLRELVG